MTSHSTGIHDSLPGPKDIFRTQLANGIVVLARSNFSSPSIVISGYLSSGSQYDPPKKLGLAHFTSLALTRGTRLHNFQEYYDTLESVGASLVFGASVHNVSFSGRCLVEDFPMLVSLLSESLQEPTFPEEQVERLRGHMFTGLAIRAQDTGDMASLAFDEIVFPDHPYGRPEDGFTETIRQISRADLVNFHHNHYGPSGMVIVIVGGIIPEKAHEIVEKYLGDWKNPLMPKGTSLPEPAPLEGLIRKHITLPGKYQTDLVIGTLGPRRSAEDYMAASLGNNILGQFGMMGRIGDVVREQSGLAYYASTSLNAWIVSGSWEVSAGVNPVNLEKAIDLILKELDRFRSEKVLPEELTDCKSNFIGKLPLAFESNAGVAGGLLNLERFQLGLDYYHQYRKIVLGVTEESILQAAHKYIHPERLAIVSSGPEQVDLG